MPVWLRIPVIAAILALAPVTQLHAQFVPQICPNGVIVNASGESCPFIQTVLCPTGTIADGELHWPAPACMGMEDPAGSITFNWTTIASYAADMDVAADGTAWIVGSGDGAGRLYERRRNATIWAWVYSIGRAKRVSVARDKDNTVYYTNDQGGINEIFTNSAGFQRQPIPGRTANDIAATHKAGELWVVTTDCNSFGDCVISHTLDYGRTWKDIDSNAGLGWRISVDPQGNPWLVNSQGSVLRWRDGRFERTPGMTPGIRAKDISAGADGMVWVTTKNAFFRQDWQVVLDGTNDNIIGYLRYEGDTWRYLSPTGLCRTGATAGCQSGEVLSSTITAIAAEPNGNIWLAPTTPSHPPTAGILSGYLLRGPSNLPTTQQPTTTTQNPTELYPRHPTTVRRQIF